MIRFLSILLIANAVCAQSWPCSKTEAVKAFKEKTLLNQYQHFKNDPYKNQTAESYAQINAILLDRQMVCAIKYQDTSRATYTIKTFENAERAHQEGHIITHQGPCGACSNTNDLAIYLSTDLTAPARRCGMIGAFTESRAKKCLIEIGFTSQCAEIWLYNTINTRKECFSTCMWAWISNKPNTNPDGSLNDCLQCDEDKSGPVFKFFSGRSRRNSGIRSEIDRPSDQVYNITHCYY